jgi:8-oxo-dGTP pyrophosphatase MutT (NUDIX family)
MLQIRIEKLIDALESKSCEDDWRPALNSLLSSLADEIEKSHLSPFAILAYFQRRAKLWDDFQSSLVLQPVTFDNQRGSGLVCVWTFWGENRPTLPGGRVNAPDEHSLTAGYIETSKERAAQELFEETGIQVNPERLTLLSALDVRVLDENIRKINNHQLNFFLAPAISEKFFKSAICTQSGTGVAYEEIAELRVVESYQEFQNAVDEWEKSVTRQYPYDRVRKAIELFFNFDLSDHVSHRLFNSRLVEFNDVQNAEALGKV